MAWGDAPALLTKDLKRDVKWEYVKKINHRIAKLGPTLVQLTSTGVYHTEPLPPGGRRLERGAPVKKIDGGPTVVGCFVGEHLAVAKYLLACGERAAAAKALSRVSRAGLSETEREAVKVLGGVPKP